jgi:pescadillo
MAKIIKKGTRGAAANYITRTRAVRKLQISLAEFRRLCILKGIYPRDPKNKKKASGRNNSNNTFYYVKDINYLLHEPILQKFRERKVFMKKLLKAIGKNQLASVKTMEENAPSYSLDHLVKER